MNLKIFIASMIVAIVLAALSFFINFYILFPAPLAIFVIALLSGCITTYWVCSAEGVTSAQAPARRSRSSRGEKKQRREKKEPRGKPVNDGAKETGNVKWFSASKGFGFITRDNGEDIFVHFRSILGKGHRILRDGQRVEFAVTEGTKGLQAEDVSPVKE